MYIIKNALVNIKRNKGRNILIALIIIVIAAACTITLAIRESAEKIITSYEEQNKIETTISLDRESIMKEYRESNKSQEEMINAFGTKWGDDGLEYSYYMNNLINVNEQLEFIKKNKNNTSAMAYLHYMNMYRNYKRTFNI